MRQYLLPAEGQFYKVNMHSHSVFSDGKCTPEEIKEHYLALGYSAVAFTEHDAIFDFSHLTDDRFIAITSVEYYINHKDAPVTPLYEGSTLPFNYTETIHMNFYARDPHNAKLVCYNPKYLFGNAKLHADEMHYDGTPDYRRVFSPEGVKELVDAFHAAGFYAVYNHPHWSMNNAELFTKLEGFDALEIINGGANLGSDMDCTPYVYEQMMRTGKRMACVAGDDNHSTNTEGTAWTMIKAPALTYDNLFAALERGECYASDGPSIEELYYEDGVVTVRCSDAAGIYLSTAGRRKGRKLANAEQPTINEAQFRLDPTDICFRIAVRDAAGKHAFTRYYYFDELQAPPKAPEAN